MSFSGGVYTLPGPALVTGEVVSATENNQFRNDVAGAFNVTMLRNGTSTATANLPMGGYKLTGSGSASANGEPLVYGQSNANLSSLTIGANKADSFPSGTAMLFVQTSAPTGWTKSVTHNDKALRVVSGTASSGGSVAFTTAFASQAVNGSVGTSGSTTDTGTVGSTTLSTSQIPSHSHYINPMSSGAVPSGTFNGAWLRGAVSTYTSAEGGGGSHNHSLTMNAHTHSGGTFTGTAINLAVQYVDVIIATKD